MSNVVKAQLPTFRNSGSLKLCVNGSYYLNPSTTNGTFSSANPTVAKINSSGYVTGVSTGTTTVSLVTSVGTVSSTITVGSTSTVKIVDPSVRPNYRFDNSPHGPIDGTINYMGYNGFTYSSQAKPINTGYYRASKQVGIEAGCPIPFYIIKCDACLTLTIGQSYGGGIVFYVTDGGSHGLIAATENQGQIRWYNGAYNITGATSTAIETGLANTNAIIGVQGEAATTYAAGLARAYRGGGYTDWYLPSKNELNLMYTNIGQGNSSNVAPLPNTNIGGFSNNNYWSSSEFDINNAWFQNFSNGQQINATKYHQLYVRAVRSF